MMTFSQQVPDPDRQRDRPLHDAEQA